MFISVAAAALDKYEWYQYLGRKTLEFTDHNRKYDLDLATKMKYGIRKYGTTYKLTLLAEPDIIFTLNEREVAKVTKLSKGWKGTVKGVKLKAGIGGKDDTPTSPIRKPTSRRERVHVPEAPTRSKYFPPIPMPPRKADIARAYTYLNKLLFDNECPSELKITFPAALKFRGQAQVTRPPGGAPEFTLKLAKNALTDPERITNIIVHEMIHLLHYKRLYIDGDMSYKYAGHGPLFISDMNRLNKLGGYSIDITEKDVPEAKLLHDEFVLVVDLSVGQTVFVHSPKPFEDKVETLLSQIRKRINPSISFLEAYYGKTQSSFAYQGMALTAKNTLSRNRKLRGWGKSVPFLPDFKKSIQVKWKNDYSSSAPNVRQVVVNAIGVAVDSIESSYPYYLVRVCDLASVVTVKSLTRTNMLERCQDALSDAENKLARDRWMSATDEEILESPMFRNTRKAILRARLDGSEAALYLGGNYDAESLGERGGESRYAALCVEAFGDILTLPDAQLKHDIAMAAKHS